MAVWPGVTQGTPSPLHRGTRARRSPARGTDERCDVDWVGDFFGTLPQVGRALWTFGRGWAGLGVSIGSAVLTIGFLVLAKQLRDTQGWLSAILGTMAATIAAFWAFGILPSAWVYFLDGQRDLMENAVIPGQLSIGGNVIAANFYQVFRDSVVMMETFVAMGAFAVAAMYVQKHYPRSLAEGEEARPQSGGYK